MTKLHTVVAAMAIAALTSAPAAFATLAKSEPGSAPVMKIVSFTGQIQIKMPDGSIVGVVPGAAMPDIPAGAEVTIVSGEAVLKSGDVVVTAAKGDGISFGADAGGKIQIGATNAETKVTVTVGGSEVKVGAGDKIAINSEGASGKAKIDVVTGSVEVTAGGKTTTVETGQSTQTAAATTTGTTTTGTTTTGTTTTGTTTTGTTGTGTTDSGTTTGTTSTSNPPSNPAQDATVSKQVSPSSP